MNSKILIFFICLFSSLTISAQPWSMMNLGNSNKKVAFHIRGQSNAGTSGVPLQSSVYPTGLIPNAFIMGSSEFEQINLFTNTKGGHSIEGYISNNYSVKPIYFSKVWQGSTSLIVDWPVGSALSDSSIANLQRTIDYFSDSITVDHYLYWNQWESDAGHLDRVNQYYDDFLEYISSHEDSTGIKFKKIIAVYPRTDGVWSFIPELQAVFDSLDTYSEIAKRMSLVSLEDAVMQIDNTHYDSLYLDTVHAPRVMQLIGR